MDAPHPPPSSTQLIVSNLGNKPSAELNYVISQVVKQTQDNLIADCQDEVGRQRVADFIEHIKQATTVRQLLALSHSYIAQHGPILEEDD